MNYAIFVWNGKFVNYIKVCFESLRLYNKNCEIYLYYNDKSIKENLSCDLNINFIEIDEKYLKSPQYYQIYKLNELVNKLNQNDKMLALDCDLLFQNDPFLVFKEGDGDLYYSHSILSTPDSLRPKKIWKSLTYKVNSGVFGFNVNNRSKKFLDFWIKNLDNPSWDKWVNYKPWIVDHADNKWWWVDQDFINCVDNNKLPFPLNIVIFSYKYNYFTSTWGFFNENLEMSTKIGNNEFGIIHFKANFKDVYNLENPEIYNMKNILDKKKLTTDDSIERVRKKFLSRGEKRFHIV